MKLLLFLISFTGGRAYRLHSYGDPIVGDNLITACVILIVARLAWLLAGEYVKD